MNSSNAYWEAAQAYADGVRELFAPPAPTGKAAIERGERAGRGPASPADLAAQAEQLASLSANLTRAATGQLAEADPAARVQASTSLLAKALTDLEISAYLLQTAQDEEDQVPLTRDAGVERSPCAWPPWPDRQPVLWPGTGDRQDRLTTLTRIEENLNFLLGRAGTGAPAIERTVATLPSDMLAARTQLSQSVEDTLDLVRERAARTGQAAVSGLLTLGLAEIARAAGLVGMDIAQALGQAEKVTRLYHLFRQFALSAYDSLAALLGPTLAQTAAQQVLAWVNDVAQGEQFGQLLEKLYETQQTAQHLSQVATASQASLEKFVAAIQSVDGLNDKYQQQIGLVDRLLRGLRLLGGVPAAALPQGRLLLAAAFIVLVGYVILAGADFVDARRLRLLNRVPGVRQVVETNLASA